MPGRIDSESVERGAQLGRPSASLTVRGAAVFIALGWAGCAERPLPEIPAVPVSGWEYVEGLEPEGGPGLSAVQREQLGSAWDLLEAGGLRQTSETLELLLVQVPEDPGVLAASGFFELRRGRPEQAEHRFERSLSSDPDNALAAVGSVLAILDSGDAEALFRRLRRLEAIQPDGPAVREILPRVTSEVAETRLLEAREAARSGGAGPAVSEAYRAVLEAMPESSDLVFEAAQAAAAAGEGEQARNWFEQVMRDPAAGERQALTAAIAAADLLAEAGRVSESLARLDRIRADADLERHPDLQEQVSGLADRLAYARFTERYDRIRETERGTREQLAAALVLVLGIPERSAGERPIVIAVDLERSWAADQILEAVSAGYLRVFPDNTFKPRDYVTRAELAEALAAALGALDREAFRSAGESARNQSVADVAEGHRQRAAIALAVKLGLLALDEGSFRPLDFASGAEMLRSVEALGRRLGRSVGS